MRGFLSVNYDDCTQDSYEGFELCVRGGGDECERERERVLHFNTGDPVVDYVDYLKYLSTCESMHVSYSSSVDHFFMDGERWGTVRVDFDSGQFVDTSDMTWEEAERYPVIVVTSEFKCFGDVVEYYRSKK